MAGFVKLDCGILESSLWDDRDTRDVFITALLMAEPVELAEPMPQIEVDSLEHTGFVVPPGWYGFIRAAGPGIIRRSLVASNEAGMRALKELGSPDRSSRTPDHDGRRLVRIDGGFVVLNWEKYRARDYTSAERSRRWREKSKQSDTVATRCNTVSTRSGTQAEAEAEAEMENTRTRRGAATKRPEPPGIALFPRFWAAYDKKRSRVVAEKSWAKAVSGLSVGEVEAIIAAAGAYAASTPDKAYRKDPATWLNQRCWEDEIVVPTGERPVAPKHPPNMPFGLESCNCPGCVSFKEKNGGPWRPA